MKVYLEEDGEKRLVGRADIPADTGPVYEVQPFGTASVIRERFTIGVVTRLPAGQTMPVVERAVLLSPGQIAELLPGWQPLASCRSVSWPGNATVHRR
jgi:hypothetical protein